MAKTITETENFEIQGQEVVATYEVEDLRGHEACDAFIKVVSIKDTDGDLVHEEDFEWMADSIRGQIIFHQFAKGMKSFQSSCGRDQFLSLQQD